MDDRGANIDLVFRNGLKDYEILPPPEVWNNIQPAIKRRSPYIFLRAAALVAAVTTISIVAWMMSRETALDTINPLSAFNIDRTDPLHAPLLSLNTPETRLYEFIQPEIVIPEDLEPLLEPVSEASNLPPSARIFNVSMPDSRPSKQLPGFIATSSEPAAQEDFVLNIFGYLPEPVPEPAVKERWSISALASPTYYSKFGSAGQDPVQIASEQPAGSYSGGLSVAYKINKRLSIQTGVFYASHGQHIDGINSFAGFQQYTQSKGGPNFELTTASGTVITSNADVFLLAEGVGERLLTQYTSDVFDPVKASLRYIDNSIIQNFSYLQMPVMLRYKLIDRNLDFNIVGGIASDFLIGNSTFAHEDGSRYRIGETTGVNSLAFSSSVGMGFEYNFSRKISLNLEPTFRYFINPFHTPAGPRIYPYSFGVFSGFSYKF